LNPAILAAGIIVRTRAVNTVLKVIEVLRIIAKDVRKITANFRIGQRQADHSFVEHLIAQRITLSDAGKILK